MEYRAPFAVQLLCDELIFDKMDDSYNSQKKEPLTSTVS